MCVYFILYLAAISAWRLVGPCRLAIDAGFMVNDYVCPPKMTVKKTLSEFRRTHHDNWQEHRQCFTDDQLLVLTDLLVSPCYYA